MKSKYILCIGTLIGLIGLFFGIFSKYYKISYTLIMLGITIQAYAIYLVKRD